MNFDKITVHCSATQNDIKYTAQSIRDMHLARGWSDIGYHWVITTDGTLEEGRPLSRTGAHVRGHNRNNMGICLIGGVDKHGKSEMNFTDEQLDCLARVIFLLSSLYSIPEENIQGHRDFPKVAKDCPCFDVKEWLDTGIATF